MTKARDLADLLDASGNLKEKQGRTVGGRDLKNDGTKLDGIEAGATADQTHSEIRALITAGVDTNVFTDADHSKLDGIEAGATADQTAAEIKTAYESNANTNEFSDAEQSKLAGIETGATADQTKADIDALNVDADTLDGQHGSYYTSYADTAVANIVDSAPGTLDTLNELAAALGDDPNFATTTATNIGTKANKTITVSAGSGLTGGGDLTANRTISHADTSSQPSLTALTGAAVVSDIDVDTYGHVTGLATRNITLANLGYTGETNATADQTASEIRSLVEAATDSNVFTDADHNKLNAIEANAKDDQTITAGSGLTGGGTGNVTLNHADTSNVSNANNSGNTFIQDINFDGFGHVTSVGTGTVSVGNGTLTVQGTGALGGSGTFSANQSGNATISISHDDTSSQGSVNNSGATVIQDVTLDGYGHITGLASKTLTLADLGGSASADSIETFSSEPPVSPEGGIYYNTVNDNLYISDGTTWGPLIDNPPSTLGGTAALEFTQNTAITPIDVSQYFTDPEGLALTYTSTALPAGLSLSGSTISGTPTAGGQSSFNVTATDPKGNSSTPKSFSVNVLVLTTSLFTTDSTSTLTNITGLTQIVCVGGGGFNGNGRGGAGGVAVSYVDLNNATLDVRAGFSTNQSNPMYGGTSSGNNGSSNGGAGSWVKLVSGTVSAAVVSGFGDFLCVAGGGGGAGSHGNTWQRGGMGGGGAGHGYEFQATSNMYAEGGGAGQINRDGGGNGGNTNAINQMYGGNGGTSSPNNGGSGGGGYGGGGGGGGGASGNTGGQGGVMSDWNQNHANLQYARGGGGGAGHGNSCGGSGGGGGSYCTGTNSFLYRELFTNYGSSQDHIITRAGIDDTYGRSATNGYVRITNNPADFITF
jgi:hypothetical protein